MTGLSDAIKEAYAVAPADDMDMHTLEIRHASFVDDNNDPTSVFVVRDHQAWNLRLEESAPIKGGEVVEFLPVAFDLVLPTVDGSPSPELTLVMDNVSGVDADGVEFSISDKLEIAAKSARPIYVIYRPYLSSDLNTPQIDPPIVMTLVDAKVEGLRVVGRAGIPKDANLSFPNYTYTARRFPGIAR